MITKNGLETFSGPKTFFLAWMLLRGKSNFEHDLIESVQLILITEEKVMKHVSSAWLINICFVLTCRQYLEPFWNYYKSCILSILKMYVCCFCRLSCGYFSFILSSADIKAQKNIMHRRQIIDTTLLKCYLQVSERKARGLKLSISYCFQNLPSFLIIHSSSFSPHAWSSQNITSQWSFYQLFFTA